MNKLLLFSILCISSLSANLIHPPDGSELSYIHIMFEWQAENTSEYKFELYNSDNTRLISENTIALQYLVTDLEYINWESSYFWRVSADGGQSWINTYSFSTGSTLSTISVTHHDEIDNYAAGYTIFGSESGKYSAIIDKMGNEIWNSGDQNIIYYNFDENGSFFGAKHDNTLENSYPGIKFSLTDSMVWQEPNDEFVHHEFMELPWGDYMGIVHEYQNGPIHATGTMQMAYWTLGYTANGVKIEWPWQGDRLVIWDQDSKDVKWTWSTFDHFDMSDYNSSEWNQMPTPNGHFDWTHVNAFYLDDKDSSIYISTRNLSRITKIKIEYNNITGEISGGDIIWNMGREDDPSGQVDFGHNLGFSKQHSISLTDEENILIFDNGNYSVDYLNTNQPLSRALEISVSVSEGEYSANIAWEYELPGNLFGSDAGNVQQLTNGNYLITTIGNNGTTLEVTSNGDLVWEVNYSTLFLWRASRIETLYPDISNLTSNPQYTIIDEFKLYLPYPNPFNPIINIEYDVPKYSFLTAKILNLNGQLVETIYEDYQYPGKYSMEWNATSKPSGMYLFVLDNQISRIIQKIMLVK